MVQILARRARRLLGSRNSTFLRDAVGDAHDRRSAWQLAVAQSGDFRDLDDFFLGDSGPRTH